MIYPLKFAALLSKSLISVCFLLLAVTSCSSKNKTKQLNIVQLLPPKRQTFADIFIACVVFSGCYRLEFRQILPIIKC